VGIGAAPVGTTKDYKTSTKLHDNHRKINPMSTLSKNPKDWTEDDLNAFVRDRIEENARLEYKREVDLSPKGRKEACKDVSAFANGQGGTIVYGMEEDERKDAGSIPKKIKPITDASIKESLENVLLSGVLPPLHFWIWPVPVKGGHCLAVHIPQSPSTHMVTISGENRYYIRRNFQSSPMTEDEIRDHYARILQAKKKAWKRYRSERTNIDRQEPTEQLVVMPLIHETRLVDPVKFPADKFREDGRGFLNPRLDWAYEFVGKEYTSVDIDAWSRITTSGLCEHIYHYDTEAGGLKKFYLMDLLKYLHDMLLHYGRVYKSVQYYGQVKVFYRLLNTKDGVLAPSGRCRLDPRPKPVDNEFLYDLDMYVENLHHNPLPFVRDVMDHMWVFFGYQGRCPHFNEDNSLKKY